MRSEVGNVLFSSQATFRSDTAKTALSEYVVHTHDVKKCLEDIETVLDAVDIASFQSLSQDLDHVRNQALNSGL